jgi:hypothetical protein
MLLTNAVVVVIEGACDDVVVIFAPLPSLPELSTPDDARTTAPCCNCKEATSTATVAYIRVHLYLIVVLCAESRKDGEGGREGG